MANFIFNGNRPIQSLEFLCVYAGNGIITLAIRSWTY